MDTYNTISTLNEAHKVYIVQHITSHRIYVKKILDVYNICVYEQLYRHPVAGIPRIINYYEQDNRLVVIEEYVSGISLQDKIANSELTPSDVQNYMLMLCDTLFALHTMQPPIIHRDIKPSNIIITSSNTAMLLDFNAAKEFHENSTSDTVLLGTPGYAAPEQYGFGSSTPQTDIYSLGIVLREMVSSLTVPAPVFTQIINRCTQLTPEARYHSVAELRQELIYPTAFSQAPQPAAGSPRTLSPQMASSAAGAFSQHQPSKTVRTDSRQSLLPPGFRTGRPWKMILASIIYLFLVWFSMTLDFKDVQGFPLWFERFAVLAMFLSIIFCGFNYLGIQNILPLCKSRHRLLHYIGIVILDVVFVCLIFLVILVVESAVFHIY